MSLPLEVPYEVPAWDLRPDGSSETRHGVGALTSRPPEIMFRARFLRPDPVPGRLVAKRPGSQLSRGRLTAKSQDSNRPGNASPLA
jgi:hypothetical protein